MSLFGRYELKYVLDESRALAVAKYVRNYLQPSEYSGHGPVVGYPVISLYLDSPDFALLRQVTSGHKNRFKLRIRFYDDNWRGPAFLEVKRRTGELTRKHRAKISREGIREMLLGGWPRRVHWPDSATQGSEAPGSEVYDLFWRLCVRLQAKAAVYVSYLREAYEQPGDSELRVTFDRLIRATPYDRSGRLTLPMRGFAPCSDQPPYFLPHDAVVLELKFDHRAPAWMFDLARIFGLHRQAMCKYCACMERLGLHEGNWVDPLRGAPLLLAEAAGPAPPPPMKARSRSAS